MPISDQEEAKIIKMAIYAATGFLVLVILSMTTCTMHSNAYEADVVREETGQVIAQTEVSKLKLKQAEMETMAIKALVDRGVHPLAARCAISGYSSSAAGDRCERVGFTK